MGVLISKLWYFPNFTYGIRSISINHHDIYYAQSARAKPYTREGIIITDSSAQTSKN